MKTRLIMIIALTIALFSLILGFGIGMKKAGKTGKEAARQLEARLTRLRWPREMWDRENSSRSRFLEGSRKGVSVKRLKEDYFDKEDK